jgi:pSer/pThr/pTyr-binding forkhead associated (FHA) protein
MPAIIVVSGAQQGLCLPLGNRTSVIGRGEGSALQIEDPQASRKHAQIRFDQGGNAFKVLDMKSANGTYLNGQRLNGEAALKEGDEIRIGDTPMVFTGETPSDKVNAMAVLKKLGERHRSTLMRKD